MKRTAFLAMIALIPAAAQIGGVKPPPTAVAAKPAATLPALDKPAVALQTLGNFEKEMDARLGATGAADPCMVLGLTRGLYINGVGAVFTSEVDLVNSPSMGMFGSGLGPEAKISIRKRKLAHVPLLQQSMRDMVLSLAASPVLKMADNDQIVVAVRLVYRPWEDTSGLPSQILLRSDRRGGAIKMELQ